MAHLELDIAVALRAYELRLGLTVGRETVALVGPSGAGKTTVLRAVAGLRRPDAGHITVADRTWFHAARGIDLAPERRTAGLVFQDQALFPHLTVRQNVAFGGPARADELLERLRISSLAEQRPGALSGGERQRVALARALARAPEVLLLDEPLSALDAHTRLVVRDELHDLLSELRLPTVLVTHDHRDAVALADRVGVLIDGRLRQLGVAQELSSAPADPFVAAFTGANVLYGQATRAAGGLTSVVLDDGRRLHSTDPVAGRVAVVVSPWSVRVTTAAPDAGTTALAGTVSSVAPDGDRLRVRLGGVTAEMPMGDGAGLARGRMAWAVFDPSDARLLAVEGRNDRDAVSLEHGHSGDRRG